MSPSSHLFTVFLGLLSALPALSIDISAPSLPSLPSLLSTSTMIAGLTLSLFMGGFALGQFGAGVISDRRGRKPVLLAGLTVYILAGLACAVSLTGPVLVASRFVQGVGAGACSVLSFAMVQDLFEGAAARSKRAYVTVILGGTPIFAPALGATVGNFAGWRAVYIILALGGGLLLLVTWLGLSESRVPQRQHFVGNSEVLSRGLLRDRKFVVVALINALSYGAIFTYIAGSPVLILKYYGGSSRTFALVFASTASALTMGAWIGGRLGQRGVTANALLSTSLAASAAASIALYIFCMAGKSASGAAAIPLLLIVLFSRGIISPNLQHLAIDRQRARAGAASAVLGIAQLSFGALSSAAVASLLTKLGPLAVATPMMMLSIGALVLWKWISRDDVATAE